MRNITMYAITPVGKIDTEMVAGKLVVKFGLFQLKSIHPMWKRNHQWSDTGSAYD